jgi:hypothetical protein
MSSKPMTTFPHRHYNSMKGHTFKNKDNRKKNWISMSLHQRNNFLHCMLIKKERSMPSANLTTKWQSIPKPKNKKQLEHKNSVFTESSLDVIKITSVKSAITAPLVTGHSRHTKETAHQQ